MRLAVVGAAGHTGSQVVEQALARGHDVTAIVRRPKAMLRQDRHLTTAEADVLDRESVVTALVHAEAVVSTLGIGTSREPTVIYSQGITNVLSAMDANRITKLAVVSAMPVGSRAEQPFLVRGLLLPVLEHVFGATYGDMRRMEITLRASDVDWIALRPPRLVDRAATGHYRMDANQPLPKGRSITYADLATALLDVLERDDLYRRSVYIAN